MKLWNLCLKYVDRFKQLDGSPKYIARGMAVGVFVGTTPTLPLHTLLSILFAVCVRGSKRAAALAQLFGNPFTSPFFYIGSYKVGFFILGDTPNFDLKNQSMMDLMKVGMDVTCAMLLGGAVMGVFTGISAYFFTLWLIKRYRDSQVAATGAQTQLENVENG